MLKQYPTLPNSSDNSQQLPAVPNNPQQSIPTVPNKLQHIPAAPNDPNTSKHLATILKQYIIDIAAIAALFRNMCHTRRAIIPPTLKNNDAAQPQNTYRKYSTQLPKIVKKRYQNGAEMEPERAPGPIFDTGALTDPSRIEFWMQNGTLRGAFSAPVWSRFRCCFSCIFRYPKKYQIGSQWVPKWSHFWNQFRHLSGKGPKSIFEDPYIENTAFSPPEGSQKTLKIDAETRYPTRYLKSTEMCSKMTPLGIPLATLFTPKNRTRKHAPKGDAQKS